MNISRTWGFKMIRIVVSAIAEIASLAAFAAMIAVWAVILGPGL